MTYQTTTCKSLSCCQTFMQCSHVKTVDISYECQHLLWAFWPEPQQMWGAWYQLMHILDNISNISWTSSSYLHFCQTLHLARRSFACTPTLPPTHKVWTSSSRHFCVSNSAKSGWWREKKRAVSKQTHTHKHLFKLLWLFTHCCLSLQILWSSSRAITTL